MKIKSIITAVVTIFIIVLSTKVFAATGMVEFKANAIEAEKGNEITVTLTANSEEGINGINTKYTYDSDKLELVSESLVDTTNWSNMGTSPNITIICNSTDNIKKADLYIIKFKVKDSVSAGDKIKIETTDITLDTDAQTNSEVTIGAKKVELTVKSKPSEEPSQQNTTNKTNTSTNEIVKNETKNISVNTSKQDKTESTSKLPKTGKDFVKIALIVTAIISISIIYFKKYINNKDIK